MVKLSPVKNPVQTLAVKCKITPATFDVGLKAPLFHSTEWTMLSSKQGTIAPLSQAPWGPGLQMTSVL